MTDSRIELSLPQAEALHVLMLLDADHSEKGTPLSKSAAKKVWQHLVDAGVLHGDDKR
jgi:hypothetical protein